MSEEEKKAIEIEFSKRLIIEEIKQFCDLHRKNEGIGEQGLDELADIILNFSKYYISKDKIMKKIKELEEKKEKLKYDGNRSFADYEQFCKNLKFFKEQIDELLEEN